MLGGKQIMIVEPNFDNTSIKYAIKVIRNKLRILPTQTQNCVFAQKTFLKCFLIFLKVCLKIVRISCNNYPPQM